MDESNDPLSGKVMLDYGRKGVAISAPAKEHMRHVVAIYGSGPPGIRKWMLAPNYSHANANDAPTGGVIVFDADAPMFPDAFSTENLMTAGTSFLRIRTTKDGKPVTDAYLKRPDVLRALQRVGKSLHEVSDPISMEHRDHKTNNDTRAWTPALGGAGAYLGVFRSSVEDETSNHDEFYLGVRSSAPNVSRGLVSWLTKRKEELSRGNSVSTDVTAEEFASKSQHVSYALEAGRRNRNRMLAQAAEAIGVDVSSRSRRDGASYMSESQRAKGQPQPRVVMPDIENLSHVVRYFPEQKVVVYYNNTTPTNTKLEGVIVSQSPRLGPMLHCAHRMAGNFVGWSNPDTFSAYPVDTGRRESTRDLAKQPDAPAQRDEIFTWPGDQNWNAQLVPGYYNPADPSFAEALTELGRPAHLENRRLKPLFVVLAPTRKPRVSSIAAASSSSSKR